jgi:hypothetical protein
VTRDAALLLSLVVVGASFLLVHLGLAVRAARCVTLAPALRVLSWLPPVTPVAGWLAGARALTLAWLAHGLVYSLLRSLS